MGTIVNVIRMCGNISACLAIISLLSFGFTTVSAVDESCKKADDCYTNQKRCDRIQDVGCICKNGSCKISSGCGTMGAFFKTECGTCSEEDCEDESACKWTGGKCMDVKGNRQTNRASRGRTSRDESCRKADDCYKNGKKCDGIQDVVCICKKGLCKISSGCGIMGAFFKTECNTCTEEDCEDEGACKWKKGKCMASGAAERFLTLGIALVSCAFMSVHVFRKKNI